MTHITARTNEVQLTLESADAQRVLYLISNLSVKSTYELSKIINTQAGRLDHYKVDENDLHAVLYSLHLALKAAQVNPAYFPKAKENTKL